MKRTWKPTVAGILDIITGLPSSVFVGIGIFNSFFESDATSREMSKLAHFWIPFAILPLVGGICALRRRAWGLALAGSILALVLGIAPGIWAFGLAPRIFGLLMPITAIMLIVLSKEEFRRPAQTA